MNIFARTKCASPSEFICDHNAPVFEAIGHELSEVHEFYNMLPKNGNFQLMPSVPPIAVIKLKNKFIWAVSRGIQCIFAKSTF